MFVNSFERALYLANTATDDDRAKMDALKQRDPGAPVLALDTELERELAELEPEPSARRPRRSG